MCSIHPRAQAGWECSSCAKLLCPDCVGVHRLAQGAVDRCLFCGGVAQRMLQRKEVLPYWGLLHVFLLDMFKPSGGLAHLIGLGCLLAFLSFLGSLPSFYSIVAKGLYVGFYTSYYFLVIRKTAAGHIQLPEVEDFGGFWEVLLTAARFFIAIGIVLVPTYLYLSHSMSEYAEAEPTQFLRDPVLLLIGLLSVFYFPAAIITAAMTESTWAMLNPLYILGIILRIPGHYLVTVVAWGTLTLVQFFASGLFAYVFVSLSIPVLSAVLLECFSLVLPLTGAFMLGRLLYQNGELLGVVTSLELMEPVLPRAEPNGVYDEYAYDTQRPSDTHKPALREAQQAKQVNPSSQTQTENPLAQALMAGNSKLALDEYEKLVAANQTIRLSVPQELRLANLLERTGKFLEAAYACRRAAEADLSGPFAPRAIFSAARLLIDKVGKQNQGIAMYRYLVQHYPNDELSLRAREMLSRLES